MNILINTIDGVKQDLLQDGRRIARLKEQTTYCLIHGESFGRVTTRLDVAGALIHEGYKLYAKFDQNGDLIL
jgi:hypothetical protein